MTPLRVRGVCPHDCPDTCGVVTEVEDGRAVRFSGDRDHPITRGWLCAKVRPYLEHVYHPGRVLYPLRRAGPKGGGQWRRVSWVEAIDEIARRWKDVIAHFGAEAILPYSYSGTLGLVQMTVSSARLWNRLGASQLERSICGAAAEMAVEMTLGKRWSPPYADVIHSKLVVLWGHNPVASAPHFMPFLKQAQRAGCQVVVIDPRRTPSARSADRHVAPRPGTDGALALGLAHVLVAEGRHDAAWLQAHTVGWPQLRERIVEFPPDRVAAITGLPREEIVGLARLYDERRPGLIKIADGINRNRNGGQNVRAICSLPALTGQYGVRGGGLAYSTSGYLQWDKSAVHHWEGCPRPGRVVNMNRLGAALLGEAADPPIQALYVFGANPAASSPNAGRIVEGLRRDDLFTVVHELFLTDTADYADLVLPAPSQLEQVDLHKAYGHTSVTYNRPAIAPLGECKSNWEVMGLLATALGFHEPWLHQTADEVIDEVLAATTRSNPFLRGVTPERLRSEGAVPLAVEETPFADGRFPTPSGKVELYSSRMAQMGYDPLPGGEWDLDDGGSFDRSHLRVKPDRTRDALILLTPASHHFVSSSLASQPGLLRGEGEPFVEIHPDDAAVRGITDGDAVVVENYRGSGRLRAVVTDAVRPGVLASPKGRWAKLSGGRNVNWTTSDALGDLAGQSTFHSNRVWIRKADSEVT
ncbi:MAG TPA: molybdopterin oxidoreductase family protein [Gemmataceae bacterium]|nr:molybdopterin oxidoreductase family protein [Gemmataceae bacterium]